jgi:uncharacterized lipoprotein YmbA
MISTTSTGFCGIAAALLLAGCASAPTHFYTLSAPVSASTSVAPAAQGSRLFIEVTPVALPERLARPQLVVRSADSASSARIDILEQERWSSPFNNELRDALASGIANRLGAIDVSRGGRPADQPVYRIAVELRQFDAVPGQQVQATYGWSISRSDNSRSSACQISVTEAVGPGIDALVLGVQRTVADAVNGIAANLTAFKANPATATSCQG